MNCITLFIFHIIALSLSLLNNNNNGKYQAFYQDDGLQAASTGSQDSLLQQIGPGIYKFGEIIIDKNENYIEFPAAVNMDKGLIEYILVGVLGKLHESLFFTKVEPYQIKTALLLYGFKDSGVEFRGQGYEDFLKGDSLEIWVSWDEGEKNLTRVEQLVFNQRTEHTMQRTNWIFTGSYFYQGRFIAQIEKSIIAVYYDPIAIINNPLPERINDEIWYVNEDKVPKIGTEVKIIFREVENNIQR